jgi:hypothetical protein
MTKRVALGVLLLVGLLVGLTLEPDSGTAASLGDPDVTGSTVGANHAKPLPRITTVAEIARTTFVAVYAALLLILLVQVGIVRVPLRTGTPRSLDWARLPARRGPPALVVG